jgi:predicted esterase
MAFQQVPVFLGHGLEDEKVFVNLGREAAGCLEALGLQVFWKEYGGPGHWYSKDILNDIKRFLDGQGQNILVDSPNVE